MIYLKPEWQTDEVYLAAAREVAIVGGYERDPKQPALRYLFEHVPKVIRWRDDKWEELSELTQRVVNAIIEGELRFLDRQKVLPDRKSETVVGRRRRGVSEAIKEIILEDPSQSLGLVFARVSKKIGVSLHTVWFVRTDFLHTLAVLDREGLLDDSLVPYATGVDLSRSVKKVALKLAVLRRRNASATQLVHILNEWGVCMKYNSANALGSEFRHTLNFLEARGLLLRERRR
jgi:hypothetical protein